MSPRESQIHEGDSIVQGFTIVTNGGTGRFTPFRFRATDRRLQAHLAFFSLFGHGVAREGEGVRVEGRRGGSGRCRSGRW